MVSIRADTFRSPRVVHQTAEKTQVEFVSRSEGRLYTLTVYRDVMTDVFGDRTMLGPNGEEQAGGHIHFLPAKMTFALYLAARKLRYVK